MVQQIQTTTEYIKTSYMTKEEKRDLINFLNTLTDKDTEY
mgnify:CR=1 FL=1